MDFVVVVVEAFCLELIRGKAQGGGVGSSALGVLVVLVDRERERVSSRGS